MTTRPDPLAENLRAALLAEPAAADVDDDALLARAIDRAMAANVAPAAAAAPVQPAVLRPRRSSVRALRWALPLAAAFVASLAMAAVYMVYRSPPRTNDVERPSLPVAPVARTAPATVPAPTAASPSAPTISVDDLPTVRPRASGSAAAPEIAPVPVESPASAADLFRDANAARRAGEVGTSVDLYKRLIAHHAGTPEAHAARVSLGRLLLDKQGDPAGALDQFDAYLKSGSSDRALAEEARLGRALVFQRQGRQEEERRAWQELLERHPDTLHAARARERLRALAPESPSP